MTRQITDDLIEDIKQAVERLELWRKAEPQIGNLAGVLEALGSINCRYVDRLLYIGANGDGKLLTKIVQRLRQAGYKTDDTPPGASATHWSPTYWRDNQWGSPEWPNIYLRFTSTTCQLVQVGTEMREMPKYETQCSGGLVLGNTEPVEIAEQYSSLNEFL